MNHQIYGVLLFAIVIILIYLLNRNESKLENFANNVVDDYVIYDNAYFDFDDGQKNITLESALTQCNQNNYCYGVSKLKGKTPADDVFFPISKLDFCRTKYQGSDLEKSESKNYISYIKKNASNQDFMCITDDNLINKTMLK